MAQRQLTFVLRRVRRSSFPSFLPHHANLEDPPLCFQKIGKEFFSSPGKPTQRQTGGKFTDGPEKVANFPKQSGGKSVPSAAAKVSQEHVESNTSPEKSPTRYFLVVGACSALVIGLLTLSPWGVLKNFYVEEKKEEAHVFSEDANEVESKDLPHTKSEGEWETGSLNELKHQRVSKKEESSNEWFDIVKKDAQDGELGHAKNAVNAKESAASKKTESKSSKGVSDDLEVGKKISGVTSNEHNISEVQLKDDGSQLIGRVVPVENLLPAGLSHDVNNNQSLVTSGKADDFFSSSDTSLPSTKKESECFSDDLANKKEPKPLDGAMRRPSLSKAYYLANNDENSIHMQEEGLVEKNKDDFSSPRNVVGEKSVGIERVIVDGTHTDTVHNAFDLLEVLHAAEKRQAELDARNYAVVQKRLMQAFQQELKDAQAKELMYAEEANRLAKEIDLEKERAMADLELEQEKARETLQKEIKHKEEETEFKLKKAELLSRTQIAAAVAEEKLSYLKDVKDVKQELEALYMALFAQSEEVRQSHTVHKLAVGTFALEDAMKRGVPVEKEVALICSSYGNGGSDPLLDVIISSIPEEVVKKGTMTSSQLQRKFETMKGEVLELSLLPATGGGLLSHVAAKLVSTLKVKEKGQCTDGLDGVIGQVQMFLIDGKLANAADLLEKSVLGTKAESLAADWIKCARERAVMEQMLLLLQAHAAAVASSLA